MRKLIGVAGAMLLILPQIALAQDHEHGGGGHQGGGEHPGGGGGGHQGGAPGGGPHFGGGDSHHGGGDIRAQSIGGGGDHHSSDDRRGGGDIRAQAIGNSGNRGFATTRPEGFRNNGDFHGDRGGSGGGFRGNFPRAGNGGWHRGFYAGQRGGWDRIRGSSYTYPRGFGYRRWGLGAILPGILFGSAYYWNDYGTYGVYPPPPGDRWVRYGPDLLLINVRSGRVDDAIYGAFY